MATDGQPGLSIARERRVRGMPPGPYTWYPRFVERLGFCRVVHMPGSHEVMLSNAKLAAEMIIVAGRD